MLSKVLKLFITLCILIFVVLITVLSKNDDICLNKFEYYTFWKGIKKRISLIPEWKKKKNEIVHRWRDVLKTNVAYYKCQIIVYHEFSYLENVQSLGQGWGEYKLAGNHHHHHHHKTDPISCVHRITNTNLKKKKKNTTIRILW